jgi:hypothetical protein
MRLRPPSEELQRFKPKQELVLPPRLFRQLLNPFEQSARLSQFADDYSSTHSKNCIGTFWDNDNKRLVKLDLGYVNLRTLNLYRAAPSVAELPCQNSNEVSQVVHLSRVEGAAPCESNPSLFSSPFSENEHCAQQSEHSAEFSETRLSSFENHSHLEIGTKTTGPYVIPVQTAMGCRNSQKIDERTNANPLAKSC